MRLFSTRALQTLEPALVQAEREGYLRLLADEGQPMTYLLTRMANTQTVSESYLKRLLAVIDPPANASADAPRQPRTYQPLAEPLSKREREVLALLAEGLSNWGIASKQEREAFS